MKIINVGMEKTGTTSIASALEKLGYSVQGQDLTAFLLNISREEMLEAARGQLLSHDALQDYPWFLIYRELEQEYPDAKFILTERDPEKWIASCENYYRGYLRPPLKVVFGHAAVTPENRDHFLSVYKDHNTHVRSYFADKPDKLLIMDLSKGDGWDKLCKFIGVNDIPDEAFPRSNSTKSLRSIAQAHYVGLAKQIAYYMQDNPLYSVLDEKRRTDPDVVKYGMIKAHGRTNSM